MGSNPRGNHAKTPPMRLYTSKIECVRSFYNIFSHIWWKHLSGLEFDPWFIISNYVPKAMNIFLEDKPLEITKWMF